MKKTIGWILAILFAAFLMSVGLIILFAIWVCAVIESALMKKRDLKFPDHSLTISE